MSIVVPRVAIGKIAAAKDPRREIIDQVGDLDGYHIPGDRVLVGVYIRPEKIGNIIRPDSNVEEDLWQGKIVLLLKFGTMAFKDTADYRFNQEDIPERYSWGQHQPASSRTFLLRGCPCRLVRDIDFEAFPDDPNIVF